MNSSDVTFYWESLGENYKFNPNKKYLIYYRGCFCPPHKGHFNTIADFTHLPNANFFVHQGGRERRHGVPYELSRKIWKIYIKELLPSDKFILMGRGRDQIKDMYRHKFTMESDIIVFIAGNENYDPNEKEYEDINEKYRDIFRELRRKNKEIVFLYLNRPKQGSLSATELSKAVLANKNLSRHDPEKYNKLKQYFPENLSDKGIKYIVRKLEECDLK